MLVTSFWYDTGEAITVEDEVVVANCIMLPHKTINRSVQEEIILS
jgi:mannose-1-phosphate guanylyltransferase